MKRLISPLAFCFLFASVFAGIYTQSKAQPSNISNTLDVIYEKMPVDLQFFGRDTYDSAIVCVQGSIYSPDYDSAVVEIFCEGVLFNRLAKLLTYESGSANFSFTPKIFADTVSFDVLVSFVLDDVIALNKAVTNLVCGDVIIVNGQSNAWAEDYDNLATWQSNWIRTLGRTAWLGSNPPPDVIDANWYIAQGHLTNTQAAIGVYALGLASLIVDNHGIPVCVFNGSGGGGAISYYQRNDFEPQDLTTLYGRLLYRVKKAKLENSVKIITWNQGESEANTGYLTYADDFSELNSDWNEDYPNVEKKYFFQIPPGCVNNENADRLREVQRTLPGLYEDMEIMSRCALPGHNYDYCHYHFTGYSKKAYWTYRQISRDFYEKEWGFNVDPPMILKCGYISEDKIALIFDQPVQVQNDTIVGGVTHYLKDYIYLDGQSGFIDAVIASGDTVLLDLNSSAVFSNVSFTPNKFYHSSSQVYAGPWIKGAENKVGALTFYEFPVQRVVLDLKVFLEGPFAGNEMNTHLNSNAVIPLVQPYGEDPWNYDENESVSVIPNSDVVDWVFIELRDASMAEFASDETVASQQAGFLLKNGAVTGIDGQNKLEFKTLAKDSLFVVVYHRNHIAVISNIALVETGGVYPYDFTTGENKTFGGANGIKVLNDGVWGMKSGDGDANGQVDNLDKDDVWLLLYGNSGYFPGDFNMDAEVDDVDITDFWMPNGGGASGIPQND